MSDKAPTLCLCMIACNEAHVIERALRSVRGILDYWIICDTGSHDATAVLAIRALAGIPGELHRTDWVNFGFNRTQAIQLARPHADYLLVMDADMIVNVFDPGFKKNLTADSYEIRYEGEVDYWQAMLVSTRPDWHYVGVTHEHLDTPAPFTWDKLHGLSLTHFADGGMRADKFQRDIRLLTAALEEEPLNPRNLFYLAQSHIYLDQFEPAIHFYQQRIALAGWEEERWYAMLQLARARQLSNHPWEVVLEDFKAAFEARPWRLEPLYEIVRHYREVADYEAGYAYAAIAGHSAPYPNDLLFIEKTVHELLFPLEYGVCAYGTQRYSEAIDAFNRVMLQAPQNTLEGSDSHTPGNPRGSHQWIAESAVRGRSMALCALFPASAGEINAMQEPANHLMVLVPFHNPGSALARCLESLELQDHTNFDVLFLDDGSTDDSPAILQATLRRDPRFRLIRRTSRHGLARNLSSALLTHCRPHDIVVCVDGDDWLTTPDALSFVDNLYRDHDCWLTYGQFEFANGDYGFAQPFSTEDDFATLRDYFRASHLRTFRAGLFHTLAEFDPKLHCLRDEAGNWLTSAVDAALMCPLMELAGHGRVRFADRVLYHYNDQGPDHIHTSHRQAQSVNFECVRNKPRFAPIDSYFSHAHLAGHTGIDNWTRA